MNLEIFANIGRRWGSDAHDDIAIAPSMETPGLIKWPKGVPAVITDPLDVEYNGCVRIRSVPVNPRSWADWGQREKWEVNAGDISSTEVRHSQELAGKAVQMINNITDEIITTRRVRERLNFWFCLWHPHLSFVRKLAGDIDDAQHLSMCQPRFLAAAGSHLIHTTNHWFLDPDVRTGNCGRWVAPFPRGDVPQQIDNLLQEHFFFFDRTSHKFRFIPPLALPDGSVHGVKTEPGTDEDDQRPTSNQHSTTPDVPMGDAQSDDEIFNDSDKRSLGGTTAEEQVNLSEPVVIDSDDAEDTRKYAKRDFEADRRILPMIPAAKAWLGAGVRQKAAMDGALSKASRGESQSEIAAAVPADGDDNKKDDIDGDATMTALDPDAPEIIELIQKLSSITGVPGGQIHDLVKGRSDDEVGRAVAEDRITIHKTLENIPSSRWTHLWSAYQHYIYSGTHPGRYDSTPRSPTPSELEEIFGMLSNLSHEAHTLRALVASRARRHVGDPHALKQPVDMRTEWGTPSETQRHRIRSSE